ncbi:MAG: GDSL-type esterase/lipase family protein [Lentilitoribacter sp.]
MMSKTFLHKISFQLIGLFGVLLFTITAHADDASCPEYAVYHTTTPQRPATSDKFLQSQELQNQEPKDADIILLGDSLTRSWKTKDLQKKLPDYRVLNLGVGADRTQQIIWRLSEMNASEYNPKYVVLWIGTNNLRTDPTCAISQGIVTIIDMLTRFWPNSKVVVLETPPRGLDFSAYMPKRLVMYDEAKEKFADKNVKFVNIDKELTCGITKFSEEYHTRYKTFKKVPSPCENYKSDLLHMTKDAYQILDDLVAGIVEGK